MWSCECGLVRFSPQTHAVVCAVRGRSKKCCMAAFQRGSGKVVQYVLGDALSHEAPCVALSRMNWSLLLGRRFFRSWSLRWRVMLR